MLSSRSLFLCVAFSPVVTAFLFDFIGNFLGSVCLGRANLIYWILSLPFAFNLQTYHDYLESRGYTNGDYSLGIFGTCEVAYASHEAVGTEMQIMVEKLDLGVATRSNNLGTIRLATAPFTCADVGVYSDGYCGIGLGMPHVDHSKIRPFLDEVLGAGDPLVPWGDSGNKWTLDQIKAAATAFLSGRTSLNMGRDPGNFFLMEIHQRFLGIPLTEPQAEEMTTFLEDYLRGATLPQVPIVTDARGLRQRRASYLDLYIPALQARIMDGSITSLQLEDVVVAANGFLDAMIFAALPSLSGASAGLSGVYLHNLGGTNDIVDWGMDVDIGRAIMEAVRVFPPVFGMPYVEDNTRYQCLVGYSGYDRGIFGEDAFDYRIRFDTFQDYQSLSRNWADLAFPVNGKPETSHVCPSRSLSFNLLLGFFSALDLETWMEGPGGKPVVRPSGSGPTFWADHEIVKV